MDKRYQVFVSSTFEDLQEERKEVMQALLELDCIPAGMELFPASSDDQWSLIKRVIDDCDYYILIIGGRYGSENEQGISYTQMEFEYALSQGKHIISFLHKHPENIPSKKTDNNDQKAEKLENFRKLAQKKLVKYWETPAELGGVVSRSMIKLIKDHPADGWVKSGSVVDEKSMKEILRLQQENAELRNKLDSIATEAPKGTEIFAQGNDKVEVKFSFSLLNGFDSSGPHYDSLNFTWNELFASVAANMIDECSEQSFKKALEDLLDNNKTILYVTNLEVADDDEIVRLTISAESFNLIRVQFKALGLIQLSKKTRHTQKDTYWT